MKELETKLDFEGSFKKRQDVSKVEITISLSSMTAVLTVNKYESTMQYTTGIP
jgi:hypothetical protein